MKNNKLLNYTFIGSYIVALLILFIPHNIYMHLLNYNSDDIIKFLASSFSIIIILLLGIGLIISALSLFIKNIILKNHTFIYLISIYTIFAILYFITQGLISISGEKKDIIFNFLSNSIICIIEYSIVYSYIKLFYNNYKILKQAVRKDIEKNNEENREKDLFTNMYKKELSIMNKDELIRFIKSKYDDKEISKETYESLMNEFEK